MEPNNQTDDSLTVVNECTDHLQKLVKLKTGTNPSAFIGALKGLLHAVSTQEIAMRHFTSQAVGGIPLLVTIFENVQDSHVKQLIVLIIKEMVSRKSGRSERALLLSTSGAINPLLKMLVKSHQPFSFGDEFISTLYSLTAKIGKRDKKFAMKARLLGLLPVISSHIRFFSSKSKVLNSVLMLLKRVLVSSVNAIQMTKADLIPQLLSFLETSKRKLTLSMVYSLEAISIATRSKYTARQFVKREVTDHILQIFVNMSISTGTNKLKISRLIRAFNASLHSLLHLTQIKSGREAISLAGVVPVLISWCRSIAYNQGPHWDRMMARASIIVQRCLPPHPLPVSKFVNPLSFSLPDQKCDSQLEYSDSKTEASDSDISNSSNSSSFDSEGDSDQDSNPFSDSDIFGDRARQYRSFFDELREEKEIKPVLPNNPCMFYEENIDFDKPLVFVSQEPSPCSVTLDHLLKSNSGKTSTESCVKVLSNQHKHEPSDLKMEETSKIISCINISSKKKQEENCKFTSSEVRNLIDSAKEEKRSKEFLESVDTEKLYHSFASCTASVLPFVKMAYPDTKCSLRFDEPLVKLYASPSGLLRNNVLRHMEEMSAHDSLYREIYNLDSLLCEVALTGTSLSNNDEERVSTKNTKDHLVFESRFESGNLRKVFWKGCREYDLILNPDVNCKSHLQWFYFEVFGMVSDIPYVFNIINLEKSTSLFNEGMCPVMFSVKNHMTKKQGWVRTGEDICYYRNHYIQGASTMSSLRDKPYYTLTFTIVFPHENDVCYFAYHYPYTYSSLQTHVDCWMGSYDATTIYCKKDELCKTLAGNSLPLLTITAKPIDVDRPYIFLSARVHPGESNSSWAMKGTLDFLFSNKPSANRLREKFIFKIVPMLNPDGVINGCHRCSLSGQDLNRQWITPNAKLHPTIYHTKTLLYYLNSLGRRPLVFCDYHGHSRRHNVFLYGCNPVQSWWSSDESKTDCESYKIIPLLMHQLVPTFNLDLCCFNVERSRESTARVTVWRQFDVVLSYTMECTYGGCDQGTYSGCHIGITQLEETGVKLCQCFGKILPSYAIGEVISSTIPVDTSWLTKTRSGKNQDADSLSSSLSEDDLVDCEDIEMIK